MHGLELGLADGESFAEAGDGLVGQVLLEIVESDEEVGIARLQAVAIEELLDQLDVAHVRLLALHLHAYRIVEGRHQTERLQHPAEVLVHEHLLLVALRLGGHTSLRSGAHRLPALLVEDFLSF